MARTCGPMSKVRSSRPSRRPCPSRRAASAGVTSWRAGSAGTRRERPGTPPASSASTAAAPPRPRAGRGAPEARVGADARVERLHEPVAGGEGVDAGGGRRLALREQVVVAERGIPRRVEARRVERALGGREQPRVAWRVRVRAVDERVRVGRPLEAVVARRAGVGARATAVEDGAGEVELVPLGVVRDVAGDRDGLRVLPVERAHRRREHLGGECLLRAEGGAEDAAQAVEERDAGGRLLVADVEVGDLRERGDLALHAPAASELRALAQRLAGAALERAVPVAIDEGAREGRARRVPATRALLAAAGQQDGGGGEHDGNRAAPRSHGSRKGSVVAARHSSLSPLAIGSVIARRATSAGASAARASRPPSTSAIWPSVGASASSAKPAASRETSGPKATRSSATPASAAGTATASAAPPRTSATVGRSAPAARRTATAPRRSRAVVASRSASA